MLPRNDPLHSEEYRMEMKILLDVDGEVQVKLTELIAATNNLACAISGVKSSCRCAGEDQITDARHTKELAKEDATAKKKATAAKVKKAEEAKAKKKTTHNDDDVPSDVSAQKLKKDLIAPLQGKVSGKAEFRKYIEAHIRPMLQKEFQSSSFGGVKKDMMAACYVRTREVIAATFIDFVQDSEEDDI